MLGRKLYNKTILERDKVIVTTKTKASFSVVQPLKPLKKPEATKTTVTNIEPEVENKVPVVEAEIIEQPKVSAEIVARQLSNINKLQNLGVNFYPPNIRLGPQSAVSPLDRLIQINQIQMILTQYSLEMMYQMKEWQEQQNHSNEQTKGYTRELKHPGNVSLLLLTSIVLFAISLLLFMSK